MLTHQSNIVTIQRWVAEDKLSEVLKIIEDGARRQSAPRGYEASCSGGRMCGIPLDIQTFQITI